MDTLCDAFVVHDTAPGCAVALLRATRGSVLQFLRSGRPCWQDDVLCTGDDGLLRAAYDVHRTDYELLPADNLLLRTHYHGVLSDDALLPHAGNHGLPHADGICADTDHVVLRAGNCRNTTLFRSTVIWKHLRMSRELMGGHARHEAGQHMRHAARWFSSDTTDRHDRFSRALIEGPWHDLARLCDQ